MEAEEEAETLQKKLAGLTEGRDKSEQQLRCLDEPGSALRRPNASQSNAPRTSRRRSRSSSVMSRSCSSDESERKSKSITAGGHQR